MKKLYIEGLIAADSDSSFLEMFGEKHTTPSELRAFLEEAKGEDVEIWINSYGGDVWSAMAMYADLKTYEGSTRAFVTGLAASAATIVMLGCVNVEASAGAQFMIHNCTSSTTGDYHDMYITAEQLQTGNDAILAIYKANTKNNYQDLKNMMEKTTWMSAADALNKGFINKVVDLSDQRLVAMVGKSRGKMTANGPKQESYDAMLDRMKNEAKQAKDVRKRSLEIERRRYIQ